MKELNKYEQRKLERFECARKRKLYEIQLDCEPDIEKNSTLIKIDKRLVDSEVFALYVGLENYFDCFALNKDNYTLDHKIVNTILGIKSLRKKAFRYINGGNYLSNHFIEKVLKIIERSEV